MPACPQGLSGLLPQVGSWPRAAQGAIACSPRPRGHAAPHFEDLLAIVEGLHHLQARHLGTAQQPFQLSPAFDQQKRSEILVGSWTASQADPESPTRSRERHWATAQWPTVSAGLRQKKKPPIMR